MMTVQTRRIFRLTLSGSAATMLLLTNVCSAGLNPQAKIVGGSAGEPGARPYMSALLTQSPNASISVGNTSFQALPMNGAGFSEFSGVLVDCGLGSASDGCDDSADGKLCLIQRGTSYFSEKAAYCQAQGGIGAIIYNNAAGSFGGVIDDDDVTIPVANVSQSVGQSLLALTGQSAAVTDTSTVYEESFCGAAYLGQGWVISAAHCVTDTNTRTGGWSDAASSGVAVTVGSYDLTDQNNTVFKVHDFIVHPDYDPDSISNDIALIRLADVPDSDAITIINTDDQSNAIEYNLDALAMGWGLMEQVAVEASNYDSSNVPDTLYEVSLPLVSNTDCEQAFKDFSAANDYSYSEYLNSGMVCAGLPVGGYGTCYGDSGGPLVLESDGVDYLVGLTSWGLGCALPGLYDVFTRVTSYRSFIKTHYSEAPFQADPVLVYSDGAKATTSSGTTATTSAGASASSTTTSGNVSTETTSSGGGTTVGGGAWLWLPLLPAMRRRRKS